jgi:hypothetical protein
MMRTGISTKKLLLSTLLSVSLCCFSIVVAVKADTAIWAQTYDRDTSDDNAFSLVETSDGGYAMLGTTNASFADSSDFWLVKTDLNGNVEWDMTYGGADVETGRSLVETFDGGYAMLGTTATSGVDNIDFWLVKTDSSGHMEWNMTYGGADVETGSSLVATSDGGYALIGVTASFGAGNTDLWLIKTDAAGNMEWNQTYGGATVELGGSLVATSDGGYAIAGSWNCSSGGMDFWLIKTDAMGTAEWNMTYGGSDYDGAASLVITSDGGYAIAGYTESFGAGERDAWLVKTDADGNMEWNQTYGGVKEDVASSLVTLSDGSYVIAGTRDLVYDPGLIHGLTTTTGDFWLVKTNSSGHMEWNMTYGGSAYDGAKSLVTTSDGGYALVGSTLSFGFGGGDFWLIKTDEYGVVPEAVWVILPLVVTATLASFISKKKLLNKPK